MRILLSLLLLSLTGCPGGSQVRILTDLPKSLTEKLESAVPGVKFQNQSDKEIRKKLREEIIDTHALLLRDPTLQGRMEQLGRLTPHGVPLPSAYAQYGSEVFVPVGLDLWLMGWNPKKISPAALPRRWTNVIEKTPNPMLGMENPMSSPRLRVVAQVLKKKYGQDFINGLFRGEHFTLPPKSPTEHVQAGNRSMVIAPHSDILRSNGKSGDPLRFIHPLDGMLMVPMTLSVLKGHGDNSDVQRVIGELMKPRAQNAVLQWGLYSPDPRMAPPRTMRALKELQPYLWKWDYKLARDAWAPDSFNVKPGIELE